MSDTCRYVMGGDENEHYYERHIFAKTARENGATYCLIAAYLGVSVKRARQIVLGNRIPRGMRIARGGGSDDYG